MRVLVLRPADGAKRTAARLAELGHAAIVAPLLEPAATSASAPAGPFHGTVATSAQAFVLAPAEALAPWRSLPLAVVGRRTAQAAQAAGFTQITTQAPDAAALVQALAPTISGARLLYFAARDRKPALEAGLRAAGADILPWVVYEARPVARLPEAAADALRGGAADAALHFSRRSAEIFSALCLEADLGPEARALRHLALSHDAAAGLSALAPPVVEIAEAPDEGSLLARL